MPAQTWIALFVTVAIAIAGFIAVYVLRRRSRSEPPVVATVESDGVEAAPEDSLPITIPYATEATEEATGQCLKLAFGVTRFDYHIFADHALVMDLVDEALGEAAEQHQYFPRRPLLLPKLLQALNATDSTRQELVRLILEDPTLAGTTLKRANNAFYRVSGDPVESLDRAVAVLGVDGLRGLLSTAILQPVFRLPKGFFDRFADIVWEQAQRCAICAQTYAEKTGDDDPFVAQLLAVLRSLATLVLFRMTLDKYRQSPNVLPRPEVFVRVMQKHRGRLAMEIAKTWQLSSPSLDALDEQAREISPSDMSPLGRAVYYGELAGWLAVANHHGMYSPEGVEAMLVEQGLTAPIAQTLLQAAQSVEV
jgi:HD-like signal output (HDOD) protein